MSTADSDKPATTQIRLYDSLRREKVTLQPIDPNNVRMYVCGPTVYDFAHIGNARPIIVFDVLFRLLRHLIDPSAVGVLSFPHSPSELVQQLELDTDVIKSLNPALQKTVWSGQKYVPKDYPLRLPATTGNATVTALLTRVQGHPQQIPDQFYRVHTRSSCLMESGETRP